jgi:ABC-2 type transport system ATP-binding protein
MIRVEDLRKSYGEIQAVDGVSFEIRDGETFGLLGPNGAGKTTTILLLLGALETNGGRVEINGVSDPRRPQVRRHLGVAPQTLAIYDDLTGEENLRFFGRLYDLSGPELDERVQWALEFSGLTDRRSKRVSTYSGGMKRRLNLACGLIHDPPVILMDEPTVGVDPQSRNHIFDIIEAMQQQGRTILYTTHYMEEAQRLCDRVAIMDHGRILALDTVDGLINAHGGAAVVDAELEKPPENAADLPGRVDGTRVRVETDRPLEEVARLAASGVKITHLEVDRPDLEAVFLSLTGRSLRD